MGAAVLIDAGPLVAALSERDQHHAWARAQLDSLKAPCITCEAVISEALFLLSDSPVGKNRLLQMLEKELISLDFSLRDSLHEVLSLLRRWDGTPMSIADGCLVRMTELRIHSRVFTLDRDFIHYRRFGNQPIPVLAPWS